jgi:hemolysin D
MIKILIVDDQLVVREKLQAVFREQCDLVVVGTATDGDQAISQVQLLQPDVVLMDIEMPRKNGLEAAAEIRQRFPGIRMVMLTSSDDVDSVRESLRSGVSGYLMKQNIDAEMVNLIRSVQKGHVQFAPELMEKVFTYSEALALAEPSDTLQLVPNNTSAVEKVSDKEAIEKFDSNIPIITRLSDWSNSAREIIDGVPLPWTRGLFYCLLAFMGVALPWAALFQMDEIGTAQGRLELTGETVRREADLEGSVTVNKVLVKKGDTVKKGQIIMELDSKSIRDQIQQNQVKLEGQQQRLNQLGLMKNQLAIAVSTQQQQTQAQILEKQAQIDQARQIIASLNSNYNNQTTEKAAQLDQAAQAVTDKKSSFINQKQEKITQVIQAKQNIIDSSAAHDVAKNRLRDAQTESARFEKLYRSGAIAEVRSKEVESLAKERDQSKIQSEANLQQAKLRYREQQNNYGRTMQQAQADIEQAQLRLKEQQGSFQRNTKQLQSDIEQAQLRLVEQQRSLETLFQGGILALGKSEQQLKEVQSQIITLENEVEQSKSAAKILAAQLKKYTVRADIDGTIFELPISREGSVIQPKQLIAEIAPPTNGAKDLTFKGDILAGQSESLRTQGVDKDVKLKFDEFPFQTYGIVNGKLKWISPNSKVVETPAGNIINYEVKISLNQSCVRHKNECLPFRSGQPATAEIIIRKRRILDLIMDPFTKLKA